MFKNEKFEIRIAEHQVYRLKIFENAEIEVEDVKEMRGLFKQFAKEQKFTVLLDATNSFYVSVEAKALLASKEYTKDRIAAAFVVKSLANRIVGNFFIKFNKPATPTKLFSEEAEAMKWLKEIVEKDKKISLATLAN